MEEEIGIHSFLLWKNRENIEKHYKAIDEKAMQDRGLNAHEKRIEWSKYVQIANSIVMNLWFERNWVQASYISVY